MRLTILTVGSRGDVQPYIALGMGLQQAGYEVVIATHGLFAEFVTQHGLGFTPVAGNPLEMLNSAEARRWLDSDRNPVKFVRYFAATTKPYLTAVLADSLAACDGSDAVLYSILGMAGYHVAEKLGVPGIMTLVQPFDRTRQFPSVGAPSWFPPGRWMNLTSHMMAEQVFWQPFRRTVNRWREEELGLPKRPFLGKHHRPAPPRLLTLYGYSQHVVPRPTDWNDSIHITGYWYLNEPAYTPPPHLTAFLEDGPPPIYVGFGSMKDGDPAALLEMILAALHHIGQRAIIVSGWSGLHAAHLPDSVLVLDSVPHDWLFPRMAAVVHHGGAGTTAAGLRAGVPGVVVPYFSDQHFWGSRVAALGAGPRPVPRADLTVARLVNALDQAVADGRISANAARVGQLVRAEDGVATAVSLIQRTLGAP